MTMQTEQQELRHRARNKAAARNNSARGAPARCMARPVSLWLAAALAWAALGGHSAASPAPQAAGAAGGAPAAQEESMQINAKTNSTPAEWPLAGMRAAAGAALQRPLEVGALAGALGRDSAEGESGQPLALAPPPPPPPDDRANRYRLPSWFNYGAFKRLYGKQYPTAHSNELHQRIYLETALKVFEQRALYRLGRAHSLAAVNELSDLTAEQLDDFRERARGPTAAPAAAGAPPSAADRRAARRLPECCTYGQVYARIIEMLSLPSNASDTALSRALLDELEQRPLVAEPPALADQVEVGHFRPAEPSQGRPGASHLWPGADTEESAEANPQQQQPQPQQWPEAEAPEHDEARAALDRRLETIRAGEARPERPGAGSGGAGRARAGPQKTNYQQAALKLDVDAAGAAIGDKRRLAEFMIERPDDGQRRRVAAGPAPKTAQHEQAAAAVTDGARQAGGGARARRPAPHSTAPGPGGPRKMPPPGPASTHAEAGAANRSAAAAVAATAAPGRRNEPRAAPASLPPEVEAAVLAQLSQQLSPSTALGRELTNELSAFFGQPVELRAVRSGGVASTQAPPARGTRAQLTGRN